MKCRHYKGDGYHYKLNKDQDIFLCEDCEMNLLIKMKRAGCVSVWFGVESGSQKVLDEMKKGISTNQTVKTVALVRELGLEPVPNVLLGFPGETKETAWKTIKFAEKLSPDNIAFFNIATPLPGTPLYDKVKKKGWLNK